MAPVLPAAGQRGQTFRTGTDLVEVDVVVRDKDGPPVRGLRPEDFTLLDRGKPVALTAFEEVARGSAELLPSRFPPTMRVDVATNTAPAASRLVAIVLDDLHTYRNRTDTVKEISRDVVAKLGQHSSMAVVFTSGDDGVEVMGRERRKAFVLISEGIAKDLWGLFDVMQERPPPIIGSADDVVIRPGMAAPTPMHDHTLLDMMEAMRRSNVATYAIDPRGLIESHELLRECFPDGRLRGRHRPHPDRPRQLLSARLRARGPDHARISAARGEGGMLSRPLATADVPLRLSATVLPRSATRSRVAITIEISEPRADLEESGLLRADVLWLYFELWRAEPRQDLAIRLVAIDESERIVASFDQTVAARDDGKVGMKLPLGRLTPGAYRLRELASDGERLAQQEVGIVISFCPPTSDFPQCRMTPVPRGP